MKPLRIVQIRDPARMKNLWRLYGQPKYLWDEWEVRQTFMKVAKYDSLMLTAMEGKTIRGFLPLWWDKSENKYKWISGWWAEYSRPYGDNAGIIRKLVKEIPGPYCLESMEKKHALLISDFPEKDHKHYGISFKRKTKTWEAYLSTIKTKKRQNIRRDIRNILEISPVIRYDRNEDIKHLCRLNIARMKTKSEQYTDEEKSVFETEKYHQLAFNRLIKQANGLYQPRIICVLLGRKVVGCDFNIIYKKRYYTILGGAAVDAVPGIGNFMNYLDIVDALSHDCNYVDFLMEAHHWKDDWMTGQRMYKVSGG